MQSELIHPIFVRFLWIIPLVLPVHTLSEAQYELIFSTFDVTKRSGLIELTCRDQFTAANLHVSEIKFWLNRTSMNDPDLREREDFGVIEEHGCCHLRFNLTQKLEGIYTCGKQNDVEGVQESPPRTLISLQETFPLPAKLQTTIITTSHGRVILDCPVKPGALLGYYSVRWMKDATLIAEVRRPHNIIRIDENRYSINMTSYSLVIDDVNVNDSSTNYQCAIFVTNPLTDTRLKLHLDGDDIFLTLKVLDIELSISSGPNNTVECSLTKQPWFTCVATGPNAPNITWTYISSNGAEMNLTDGDDYKIESNILQVKGGLYTTNSTLTILNLATSESAVVRCRLDIPGAASADARLFTIDGSCCMHQTSNKNGAILAGLAAAVTVSIAAVIGLTLIVVIHLSHHTRSKSSLND